MLARTRCCARALVYDTRGRSPCFCLPDVSVPAKRCWSCLSEAAVTFSALGSGKRLGSSPPSSHSASARHMDGLAGKAAPPPLTVTRR